MIVSVKKYMCERLPKDEDLLQAMQIAKNENCIVQLVWYVSYNGWHQVWIDKDAILEDIKREIPKYYGV